jgi:MscS family membrane protein
MAKEQNAAAKAKADAAKLKGRATAAVEKAKAKERESTSAAKLKVERKDAELLLSAARKVEKDKKDTEAASQASTAVKRKAADANAKASAEADLKLRGASPPSQPSYPAAGAPAKVNSMGKSTKANDFSEPEFFVASQDTPNVSAPPNEASESDAGSVLGRAQAASRDAIPMYSADFASMATSPLSAADPAISATFDTDAAGADAAASSLTPPTALTPSLSIGKSSDGEQQPVPGAGGAITGAATRASSGGLKSGETAGGHEDQVPSQAEKTRAQRSPRAFSLLRVTKVSNTVRRELSRVVAESNVTAPLRLPSRRDFARFAWDGMLVVTLVLLLHTGVSRTLRWIHSRFDSTRGSTKPNFPYEQSVFECMQRPLEFVSIFTVGTALAEAVSRPLAAAGLVRYIRTLRELGVIIAATWFLLRWIDRIRLRFAVDKRIDKAQVDATSRVATVITTVIAILISLDTVGVNVQTVLAFGGIGGVAIGFAGREIISNFFGGFMIFLTRPFSVGEWIRSIEETELNGTVEDIGWYLTRVRTWDKRPLYIPNSRFSTLIVENPSRMSNRRILHFLHLRLEDMPVVKDVVNSIDHLLKQHPDLDPKQHRLAYVDSFDEYSVKIWMSCYTKSVFLFDWRRVQQELLLSAYDIVREHGARLATSTTRDVRPGADPDRYGPLGTAASFGNRQAAPTAEAVSPVPPAANLGATRAGEDHLDGNIVPSIVADIESGLVTEEELSSAAAAAVAGGSTGSIAYVNSASGGGSSTASGGTNGTTFLNPVTSSGTSPSVGASGSGVGGDDSRSAMTNPPGAGGVFRGAGISRSSADALEIAAAAILAARNNQLRSDGRHSVSVPGARPAACADVAATTPGVTGSAASAGISADAGAVIGSGTDTGGAVPGDGAQGDEGSPPSSRPPVTGASGQRGGSDDPPQAGQMKISAAPRIGSSTSASSVASSAAPSASPAATVKSADKEAGTAALPNALTPPPVQASGAGSASGQTAKPGQTPSPTPSGQMNIVAAPKSKPKVPPSNSGTGSSSATKSGDDSSGKKKSKR